MAESELRPCPFCGHGVRWNWNLDFGIEGIHCQGCKAIVKWPVQEGQRETIGEIQKRWAAKWNRRPEGRT